MKPGDLVKFVSFSGYDTAKCLDLDGHLCAVPVNTIGLLLAIVPKHAKTSARHWLVLIPSLRIVDVWNVFLDVA